MKYAIVYSSKTGNTALLAETLKEALPAEDCVYYGAPCDDALRAERLYVGFWTDRGSCDAATAEFLGKIKTGEVFLFGTAGFGGDLSYFDSILDRVDSLLGGVKVVGRFMCQGKMPPSVRERYVKQLEKSDHAPNLQAMIDNLDRAASHPDDADLAALRSIVSKLC